MQSQRSLSCLCGYVVVASAAIILLCGVALSLRAQPAAPANGGSDSESDAERDSGEAKPPAQPSLPPPAGAKRLSPRYPIWLDAKEKAVIVDGQISLRQGMLEMFACIRNTKEHEAIVSADTKAYLVHAALLSLGAEAGHPVQFQPEFKPPEGTEIEVLVRYKDAKGQMQTVRAQEWVKDVRTTKAMDYPFVFGGSTFWTDPETKKKYYQAEGGDFVCVSNFGTAMLDIPVKSSQSNEYLEFEAFTEKIPPLGAPVQLIFKPKLEKKVEGGGRKGEGAAKKAESGSGTTEGEAKKL